MTGRSHGKDVDVIRLAYWFVKEMEQELKRASMETDRMLKVHLTLAQRRLNLVKENLGFALSLLGISTGDPPDEEEIEGTLGVLASKALSSLPRDARAGGPLDVYTMLAQVYGFAISDIARRMSEDGREDVATVLRSVAEDLHLIARRNRELAMGGHQPDATGGARISGRPARASSGP